MQYGTYLIVALYIGSIFFVVELFHRGQIPRDTIAVAVDQKSIDFQNLLLLIALIESSLGIYVGSIIHTLFKSKEV